MTNEELIIERFKRVKERGFIKSNRTNDTGIGKTFEDYMSVPENNLDEPDLFGYEIKSHRELSNSYVTLFTKAPSFPKKANTYLKDKYGQDTDGNPDLKKIHTSMFANSFNTYFNLYSFKLINDKQNSLLKIGIYDINSHELIDDSCGYTHEDIKKALDQKLKKLFLVKAENEKRVDGEYFKYVSADIYEDPSISKFLELIDNGTIMYDIRIGSYKSGRNYGKAHDHGSGFRIKGNDITKLYSNHKLCK